MKATELIARAKLAVGTPCKYQLGKGNYSKKYPNVTPIECDCSGFIAWMLKRNRKLDDPWYVEQNGGWLETTAIFRDANSNFGFFDLIKWIYGLPGMFLVYGDSSKGQGHIGLITESHVIRGPTKVIHCSKGNYKKFGHAIEETDVEVFKRNGAIVVSYRNVTDYDLLFT